MVPEEHKLRATAQLVNGGKQSMKALIDRLLQAGDPVCFQNILVPTGVMNPGKPRKLTVTLKFQIETILYDILYPEQAPRPELAGESIREFRPKAHSEQQASTPAQTLAEMKASWDHARDEAIGELAPAELGAAYPFIEDWAKFWQANNHKDLQTLKDWSKERVKRRWAKNMLGPPVVSKNPERTPHEAQRTQLPANIETLRRAYAQAWLLYDGAKNHESRKPIAFKGLEDLAKRHHELELHITYLLQLLA